MLRVTAETLIFLLSRCPRGPRGGAASRPFEQTVEQTESENGSSAARLTHRHAHPGRARLPTRVCVSRYRRHMRHLVTSPRSAAPAGIPHASTLYVRCMIVVQQQGYRNDPPRRRVSYARSAAGGPGGGTLVAMAGLRPQISVSAGQELCDLLGAAASPPGPTHCARARGRDQWPIGSHTHGMCVVRDRATILLIWP